MTTSPVQSLRALLAQHRPAVSRDGYPQQLQDAAGELTTRLRAEGWSDGHIARELGVSTASLRRWTRRPASPTGAFRAVTVVDPAPSASGAALLTLVTPRGFRLEGLTLEDATVLLGRVG